MNKDNIVSMEKCQSPTHSKSERGDIEELTPEDLDSHEVFHDKENGVKFRSLGWPMASVIFLKRKLLPP